MTVMKIDTGKIRADASDYSSRAAVIADTSRATKQQIDGLYGASFTGKDGAALAASIGEVGVALANVTAVLETLSQNMKVVAGNFDETESANAAGLSL